MSTELTDRQFDILKAAINLARYEQVLRLDNLKERLKQLFQGQEQDINAAIEFWANYHREKRQ